jgi:hypothetical protein
MQAIALSRVRKKALGTLLTLGSCLALNAATAREAQAQPAWAPNVFYPVSAQVTFNAEVYAAIQAHTSQVGWEPPNVPALWNKPTPPAVEEWETQTSYPLGGKVTYLGVLYEARQGHTSQDGWDPPFTPALWTRPAEPNAFVDWAPQKMYLVGDLVIDGSDGFRAKQLHQSLLGINPARDLSTWEKVVKLTSCQGKPDGSFCSKSFLHGDLDGAPAAVCKAQQCVRVNVPEAVHRYPWTTKDPIRVANVTALRAALQKVDNEPGRVFNIQVEPGEYKLTSQLEIKAGNVIVEGNRQNPGAVKFMRGAAVSMRIWAVNGQDGQPMPFLALRGVTVEGGSTGSTSGNGGAGVQAIGAGLVIEESVVKDNNSDSSGSGILVSKGFLLVQRSLIQNNGLAQACAGVSFGGGIALQAVEEAYIIRSTIRDNKHCRGGGLQIASDSKVHIEQSTFTQNKVVTFGGGIGATNGGRISLKLNTFAENEAAAPTLPKENNFPRMGAGIGLYLFTGDLIWRGNVIANNQNFLTNIGKPEDFTALKDRAIESTSLDVKLAWNNNIKNWTMAKSPADLGLASPLIDLDPLIGSLVTNQGRLPFYLPAKNASAIYRKYSPSGDFRTQVPATDQRLFKRPSVTTTTPGAIDPDATTP